MYASGDGSPVTSDTGGEGAGLLSRASGTGSGPVEGWRAALEEGVHATPRQRLRVKAVRAGRQELMERCTSERTVRFVAGVAFA